MVECAAVLNIRRKNDVGPLFFSVMPVNRCKIIMYCLSQHAVAIEYIWL